LTFENGNTTFFRNVSEQAANDRLPSLSLSDTEVALCSVRPKSVQPALMATYLYKGQLVQIGSN